MSSRYDDEPPMAALWWDKFVNFAWRTDWTQVVLILALGSLGVVAIWSAGEFRQSGFWRSQIVFLAIGWVAAQPAIASVICGATGAQQVQENAAVSDAIAQVTLVPTEFKTQDVSNAGPKEVTFPVGWRAMQLPDAATNSYFTRAFGRPNRDQTCECERTEEPSMAQALHIANGDTINQKLAAKDNTIAKLLADKLTNEQILDEAFLSTLARPPSATEKARSLKLLADAGDAERRAALEDLYWSLLSSREFLFNH